MSQTLFLIINIIITNRRMRRNAIVPQTDRALFPLDADLDILGLGDVLEQQLEQGIGFLVFETDDPLREPRVYEKGLLAGSLLFN